MKEKERRKNVYMKAKEEVKRQIRESKQKKMMN